MKQLSAFWFGIGMGIKKVWVGGVCCIGKGVGYGCGIGWYGIRSRGMHVRVEV